MWKVKIEIIVIVEAPLAVTPKYEKWLQQILEITSEIFVQRSAQPEIR